MMRLISNEEVEKDLLKVDRTFELLDSDDPFAVTGEDTDIMAGLAYKYIKMYKNLLEDYKNLTE